VHSTVERRKSRLVRKHSGGKKVIALRILRQHTMFPDALKKICDRRGTGKTAERTQREAIHARSHSRVSRGDAFKWSRPEIAVKSMGSDATAWKGQASVFAATE
jgi:hypothetical protein